jgi:choline dehydrogenase
VNSYSIGIVLNHPQSRGRLRIVSDDPDVQPEIDLNLLAEKVDQQRVIEGGRFALKCAASPEFAPLVAEYHDAVKPLVNGDDKTILEFMKKAGAHGWHICGTVRMGAADDALSPCTPDLKLKGVAGLRVADCSIMPEIVSGNTNAPAMIIGSRAAEIILNDH